MSLSDLATWHRLVPPDSDLPGIWCDRDGVTIAGTVPLLERDMDDSWTPRPTPELGVILYAGYGRAFDIEATRRGLSVAARALNSGDLAKAQIATLLLQHIVERSAEGPDIDNCSVNSTRNLVRIPHTLHEAITGDYNKTDEETGLRFRDTLKGKSFEEQYEIGLDALRKHGVIQ